MLEPAAAWVTGDDVGLGDDEEELVEAGRIGAVLDDDPEEEPPDGLAGLASEPVGTGWDTEPDPPCDEPPAPPPLGGFTGDADETVITFPFGTTF